MSSKKQGGKLTQQTRTQPKYLGVKVVEGQKVNAGEILIRQRGSTYAGGMGVKEGRDHTLYAHFTGSVKFGKKLGKTSISVLNNA